MIEHQVNARMDGSKFRRRGNFGSLGSFKPLEEVSLQLPQSPQSHIVAQNSQGLAAASHTPVGIASPVSRKFF
jgi:hypothetical protein